MTNNVAIQQTDPTSIYFDQLRDARNTVVVDEFNITWDCSNFCNANEINNETLEQIPYYKLNQSDVFLDKKKLSCSKSVLTTQDYLQFVYALWSLLGLCIVIAMLDFFKWLELFYPDPDDYNGKNKNVGMFQQIYGFCCSGKDPENDIELAEQ